MTTIAKPFRNKENYAKYLALYFEPGLTVLLTTLEWCYKRQRPIEEHLADLGATNSLRKTNIINATEQNTLEELKEGKTNLNDLDITLIYKIIQLTCDLLPRNDVAWTKACPTSRQREQEHLLFQLKDGRNKLAHPHDDQKNITDTMVEDKCKEMKDLLTKLLQTAALKANLDLNSSEFNKVNKHIEDDVQRILKGENICDSMSDHTLDLILNDLKAKSCYKGKLKSSFIKEIKEYSAPSLKDNDKLHPLKDILQLNKSSVIVVQGEAGRGKTTMSRFLFYSWLSGNTDPVEKLSSFEVAIRIDCNQIFSSDINLFYERLFPNASFAFPNTVSLKKSLDEFRVCWIMDGFDECTAEFKGFLTAMTNSLSEKHKLLITTRPNTFEDLIGILCKCKLPMSSLSLELLQDHNVEDIILTLILDDENREAFKTHFLSLDETAKHLLRTPLNLSLYIKLWKQDPELVTNTFTTKMLFLKTIEKNLLLLKERLYLSSSWSSKEDLKDFVNDWFYGSLCKQSILMLMQQHYNTFGTNDLDTLKRDARNSKLDPSSCLSTFLVQVIEDEENDEDDEESDEEDEESDEEDEESEEDDEGDVENERKPRYRYQHLTQQFVFASLFLKNFKRYNGDKALNSINIKSNFLVTLDLLKFYVAMANEDGTLHSNPKQVFLQVQEAYKLFNTDYDDKSMLWISTSVASNFNEEYMKNVSQAFKDIANFDTSNRFFQFLDLKLSDFTKFLEFVQPQKLIIPNMASIAKEEGFQSLLDVLIKFQIEITLRVHINIIEILELHVDKEFRILKHSNGKNINKSIRSRIYFDEFSGFCAFLKREENKALEHLEIWVNFHSFYLPFRLLSLPKTIVENTVLWLTNTKIENFEKVLEFLTKIKDDEILKFKALHLQLENISEMRRRQLLEIAQAVYNDHNCQSFQSNISQFNNITLNVTKIYGNMDTLDSLNTHHAKLKNIYLNISSESEFCRMFKFLHRNKTLKDVTIYLHDYNFTDFQYWERRCFFDKTIALPIDFTFPKELVQLTTIFIPKINQDNFREYLTLLYNVKGDETLKFRAVRFSRHGRSLSIDQRAMLDQITLKNTTQLSINI